MVSCKTSAIQLVSGASASSPSSRPQVFHADRTCDRTLGPLCLWCLIAMSKSHMRSQTLDGIKSPGTIRTCVYITSKISFVMSTNLNSCRCKRLQSHVVPVTYIRCGCFLQDSHHLDLLRERRPVVRSYNTNCCLPTLGSGDWSSYQRTKENPCPLPLLPKSAMPRWFLRSSGKAPKSSKPVDRCDHSRP